MKITIFTPTYNRGYILPKLYESLCSQTNKNFEWLIVDDGSTDNTREIVSNFIDDKNINIRYFYHENSGKSATHNFGVKLTENELFTCVDSDDYLDSNAVDCILERFNLVKEHIVGIIAKRKYNSNVDITKTNLNDFDEVNFREIYQNHSIIGDTFLVFKTSIIKKFQFPVFKNEKFVPEAYLYDQISEEGLFSFLNKSLYICEYLDDGYTKNMNKLIANNPNGYRLYVENNANYKQSIKNLYFNCIRYSSVSFILKNKILMKKHYFLSLLSIIPGFIMYKKRFSKYLK